MIELVDCILPFQASISVPLFRKMFQHILLLIIDYTKELRGEKGFRDILMHKFFNNLPSKLQIFRSQF